MSYWCYNGFNIVIKKGKIINYNFLTLFKTIFTKKNCVVIIIKKSFGVGGKGA